MRFLDRLQPLGLLAMRLALGAVMVSHGAQKVFGGIHNVEKMVSGIGFPWWMAYLVAGAEFFGGILVIVGLLTRLAAFSIFIDMFVAITKVHWKHGFRGEGGYEFPLALAALAFALIFLGAGPISLDNLVWKGRGRTKV